MASSSLTVECSGKEIRVYGGNRGDVKSMKAHYERLSLEQFLQKHPSKTEEDYKTIKLYTRFNKR
ncbi:hypothetical protein CVD28_03565 [Bacillus sp. M6-12]|uniref:hypothetical protein n=1 Tax=Bacillus sp. M6-12 TaxID=2054166 RepID=UPI000C7875EC|nr:hypothetical protein [Bacillus sp. M6-12]PLS19506.1 hypothetical protein CVD28_03565 [Bacillus sp. M6-12]